MSTTIVFQSIHGRDRVLDTVESIRPGAATPATCPEGSPALVVSDDLAMGVLTLAKKLKFWAAFEGTTCLDPAEKLRFTPDRAPSGGGLDYRAKWIAEWVREPRDEHETRYQEPHSRETDKAGFCGAQTKPSSLSCYLPEGHDGDHVCIWQWPDDETKPGTICARWANEGE